MFKKSNSACPVRYEPCSQSGFTLVEIIVGIVITGISLSVITTLIYPLFVRSVDPMLQVRAAEYGQAIMQDILSKPYDANAGIGGQPICSVGLPCTDPPGAESGEIDRGDFNDVDDYDEFCDADTDIQDVLGVPQTAEYSSYTFRSCIDYDGDYDGVIDTDTSAKRITVTVTPPQPAVPVVITAYRGNY